MWQIQRTQGCLRGSPMLPQSCHLNKLCTLKRRSSFKVKICSLVLLVRAASQEKTAHKIGVVGSSVDLPCDVDVSNCGKVYFITWTKNVSNEWKRLYLYSDAVEKPLQELANPDRADFFLRESTAFLRISPLRIEDDGTYKCDVTYVQGKCPSLSFATLTTYDSDNISQNTMIFEY
ncbi:ig-like domain-containing protein [Caerostris extrusa]|uniref:Ig-like domain-containing protein n=1 Tax=Caerostris extrusa TaxID=172846 RepID=A0AAV4MLS6_CAEEX|nr:ig-like domain-containing protein [Caerostris extrusa]